MHFEEKTAQFKTSQDDFEGVRAALGSMFIGPGLMAELHNVASQAFTLGLHRSDERVEQVRSTLELTRQQRTEAQEVAQKEQERCDEAHAKLEAMGEWVETMLQSFIENFSDRDLIEVAPGVKVVRRDYQLSLEYAKEEERRQKRQEADMRTVERLASRSGRSLPEVMEALQKLGEGLGINAESVASEEPLEFEDDGDDGDDEL